MPRRKQAKPKGPEFALNWQRKARVADKIPRYSFAGAAVADDLLGITLKDKTTISSGEYYYVVTTPGEPFAIGRLMEFVDSIPEAETLETRYCVRLNWLYRPSSIHKKVQNTRELLLTMHSDVLPLESLRQKVSVVNRHEVESLDKYIQKPNCFWFDRYWDRYISRFYDAIPSTQVTNIPPELGSVIRSMYQYLILEPQRTKQLTEAPQFCTVCDYWCSETDSVHCVDCDQFFHRGCTSPPIANPLKGYSWTCGPCALAHEAFLEQQRGPDLTMRRKRSPLTAEKQQLKDSKEAEIQAQKAEAEILLGQKHEELRKTLVPDWKEIEKAIAKHNELELTPHQVRHRKMWPFRYFGVNTNLKDIFDLEDSIHPRAISRVGNKHQAVVQDWPGRPVVYYRRILPDRPKRGPRSKTVSKDRMKYEPSDLDIDLPWVQEAPSGYIERGSSETSTLMWKPDGKTAADVDKFLEKTHNYAEAIGVHHSSTNFIDASLAEYMNAPSESEALIEVGLLTKKQLKEPEFSAKEIQKFEKAVAIHGNNLHQVFKSIKTKTAAEVVRFYYLWKKTEGGHKVWDSCQARVSKNHQPAKHEKFIESIQDSSDPTLAYSSEMLKKLSKSVHCKFCEATASREWRIAPNSVISPSDSSIEALCSRCSRIWYRYAIEWMNPELAVELNASKYTKFRVDSELLEDALGILSERSKFLLKKQQQDSQQKPSTTRTKRVSAEAVKQTPTKRRRTRLKKENDDEVKEEPESPLSSEVDSEDKSSSEQESVSFEEEKPMANQSDSSENSDQESNGGEEQQDPSKCTKQVGKNFPTVHIDQSSPASQDEKEVVHEEGKEEDEEDEDDDDDEDEEDEDDEDSTGRTNFSGSKEASYSYSANYCAVCSQLDPSLTQLTCQICSLSVHAKCYGFVSKPNSNTPWYCDCCLNDKDNLADHIYQCGFCPVKLPNYAAWLSGEPTGVPDALKRTWDGKWSHVRCAVWSPSILFQCSDLMQQVEAYPHAIDECNICHTSGLCSTCFLCEDQFHPGCAGAKGYAMGILFNQAQDGPAVWKAQRGSMEAVIICGAHENPDLVPGLLPMSEIDADTELTAMQVYSQHYKQAPQSSLSGSLRRSLLHPGGTADSALVIPSIYVDQGQDADPLTFFHPGTNTCIDCKARQSAYWIQYPEGFTRCCYCYWQEKAGYASTEIDSREIIQNMWKVFDASVVLPRQSQHRSMQIQHILS